MHKIKIIQSISSANPFIRHSEIWTNKQCDKRGFEQHKLNIYGEQHGILLLTTKEKTKF
jgi:hypothetical protein